VRDQGRLLQLIDLHLRSLVLFLLLLNFRLRSVGLAYGAGCEGDGGVTALEALLRDCHCLASLERLMHLVAVADEAGRLPLHDRGQVFRFDERLALQLKVGAMHI
jgi:hypothetical protein